MENRIMAALEDAVNNLRQAVNDAQSRFSVAGDVQAAVEAERAKYDELVSAEAAEDIQQNQELADARAETDRLLQEINSAADSLNAMTEQVSSLGQVAQEQPAPADGTAEPTPAEGTAEPTPADGTAEPTPAEGTFTPEPVPGTATPVPDEGTTAPATDTAAPADAAPADAAASDPADISNLRPNV
jgi:hypothetical protein